MLLDSAKVKTACTFPIKTGERDDSVAAVKNNLLIGSLECHNLSWKGISNHDYHQWGCVLA